jgi:multiple sugar transport system substrate-binding protein
MVDDKINPRPLQAEEASPKPATPVQNTTPAPVGTTPLGGVSPLPTTPPEPHSDHTIRYFLVGGAVLFFIVIFGLLLSFFLRGNNDKNTAVELNYWGVWEDQQVIQPLIDDYSRKNPNVSIIYTKMVPTDYRVKVSTRGKNGTGPDIFRFHNTWIPQMREIVAPMPSSVMPVDEFKKTFYSIHTKDLVIDDKAYGMPLYIDGLVLMYNEELFKKAGIGTAPVSWEDVLDDVAKLTVKNQEGKIVTSGIALGTASNVEHYSDILGLFLLQNGGDITQLGRPEAAGALESYRKFAESDSATWDELMPNSIQAFAQEKVAMIIAPSWEVLSIKAMNPNLSMKIVPVPVIPGSKPLSIASYWAEGVSRYSKNQPEAWKFLKFLSEKDSQTKMFELQSKVRLVGTAYSRQDLEQQLVNHEYLGAVIKQANGEGAYRSIPLISRTYDGGLNDSIVAYIQNAINETIQGVSYEQALGTAESGVTQVLTNFQIIPTTSK